MGFVQVVNIRQYLKTVDFVGVKTSLCFFFIHHSFLHSFTYCGYLWNFGRSCPQELNSKQLKIIIDLQRIFSKLAEL